VNGFSTRAIRAATRPPKVDQQANSVPIYQSVTFSAGELDELGEILTEKRPGYAYARIANPTDEVLAGAIAELHGAEDGFCFSTGMAAIHTTLLSVLRSGDRIVCTRAVYGSTRSLLANVLGGIGIRTDFVDATDLTSVETALASEPTRVLYVETISNPTIVVADLEALAQLARQHGAIFIVDNTFASPYLCRPLDLGADLVVESATKFIGGHSDVLAGVAVGNRERIARIRAVQTDTGATLAPFAAFLVLRGLTTLALRMERHSATATALASWLERQPGVDRVYHPALPSHPQASIARRQLRLGGGMLAFELAGGRPAGRAFIDALTIPERTASLGSIHTIVTHPPSTTHRQLSDAEIAAAGIAPGLLRCSVGLEDLDDLQADFAQALGAARQMASADSPSAPTGAEPAQPAAAVRP
jgi:methionine-gamma-lyase